MDKQKYAAAEVGKITSTKFDIINSTEGGGEYSMPDYYPQIRKLVSCTCDVLPDTKFISGNTLEFGGTLAFTVLYIGEDGSLVSLPYAAEYSGTQSLPAEVRGTAEIAIDALGEDIQCRVLGPRKLSLRSRIKTRISAVHKLSCRMQMLNCEGEEVSSSERAAIQCLAGSIPTMSEGRGSATGKASGEIRDKQGSKPVSCGGSVSITEVKCRKDSILVRGDACVKCLVFTPDGYYAPARARFPFEEIITAEGASEGDMCRAWGRAASVSVSEAEGGMLNAELEYDLEALWCRKGEMSIVRDAYAAGRASETERDEAGSHSLLACITSPLTVNGSGKRTTKPDANEYLIDMSCEAAIEHAEQKDAHMVFTGSCKIKAFIASNGEVICEEMTLPLKYETAAESPLSEGRIILYANAVCTDISGRLEGDSVFANAELCLSILAKRECKIRPVSKITLAPAPASESPAAQIKVCYGAKGESLWDISKKYMVPIGRAEEANGISRGEKAEGKPVIIPIGIG